MALIRRHWPFLVVLALGAALRVAAMVAYRPAILYVDSVASYMLPLPRLNPSGQDPIGYDILLLKPVLAVGTLTTVAAVQHLLGLGMAVAGYALLVRRGAGRWLAALGVTPVLLDAYQVQIEHNVMSDPLFEAMVLAALVLLAWTERPGWRTVAAAAVLLGLAATVRQVGVVLLIPLLAVAVLSRRRVLLALVALVAFGLPVAAYATYYHQFTGQFALSRAGGSALYGRAATFADCSGLDLPADERGLCPAAPWKGHAGPEFWAHDPRSPFAALQLRIGDRADAVAGDFARRVIRHQPLDFAASIGADAVKVLSWQRIDHSTQDPTVERWRFQRTFPTYPDVVTIGSVREFAERYGGGDPTVVAPVATFLRGYQLSVGYPPGPVLAVAALLALVGRSRAGLLFLGSGVLLLLAGDVALFSWRYQLPGFVLLPIAGALGALALKRPTRPPFPEPADTAALDALDPDLRFPPVVVLVAAYNEAGAIGRVLDAVPRTCHDLDVASLVVVDGGTDGTAEVARAHGATVCDVPVNRGQGAALRLGYHVAATHGARFIVTTDADGQYDLAELPLLLAPLLAGEADFVTGSRRLGANDSTDPVRRLGTRVFAALVSVLTGHRITDTSFGFRAMRAEVPATVTLRQPQYQSAELLIGALSHGYRIVERPMTMRRRRQGRSKKGNNLVYGVRYARVVVGTWWRERNTNRSRTRNLTPNSTA